MAPVADGGVVIICNTTGVDMSTLPTWQLVLYQRLCNLVLGGGQEDDIRAAAEAAERAGMV